MIRITEIIDKVYDYYPEADVDIIDKAYIYSARVHAGQLRLSGEPYLTHPLEVANILAELKLDPVSIAAGLLHDVVEDTHTTLEEIRDMFGDQVAHIVDGVTKISKLKFSSAQQRQAENIRKMILAMADDIRVILVKLADRVHNTRTLHYHKSPEKQKTIAAETMDIYSPLAARLGIYWIKKELEENSFIYEEPGEYEIIRSRVSKDQDKRKNYVLTMKTLIWEKMKNAGFACEVQGRSKQYYSIYKKMQDQSLPFEEIYDIIGLRIILDSVADCYAALGQIHSMWKPIPSKIKDYIAVSKANGYQSIHTTVIGPRGERIEIQIRTREMDYVANYGIAAHWSYKEGKSRSPDPQRSFEWLRDLVENHKNFGSSKEFLENVRIDLFPSEIFVFTPKGDVKTLPKGATPLDFAYLIHSEVGDLCTGAKVNGRLVPLQHGLKSGDIVSITTTKGHHPSKDWLNHVKTIKAKSRIRHWIRKQERERSLSLGREMCEKAFRKHKKNFNDLLNTTQMLAAAEAFKFKTTEALVAAVGFGKITPLQIIRKLDPKAKVTKEETLLGKLIGRKGKKPSTPGSGILVAGVDDILIRYGKCCQPVPGDAIIGYITHGAGVTIHRTSCVNALKTNPDRQIEVEWKEEGLAMYPVSLQVTGADRVGLLAEVTAAISKAEANISDLKLESRTDQRVNGQFIMTVKNLDHLAEVISRIKKVKTVYSVRRT
ncbi:MAG: bifunctional (p)ppGpp synthetase/guanosine-3',5'-bis(diphosphate) 3'-pyrophosphohydrolase [Deltaproteobacteria bacterium]|nr:bifunctional (p)ppGpp synthetase/guanosine-3',5'-bis(diphosphate) 3'-pyrophosphohydrolase [Deltaproteobacteria bacterium]